MLQHVVDSLPGEELVRMFRFAQAVEKQRQVVMVVELVHLHLTDKRTR